MDYTLGIDCGTTHTAAAVLRSGRAEVLRLGTRRAEMPSLVFVPADTAVLVGEAAARRGQDEPGRLAREFKRRVGDPVPMLVGGAPYSAHALIARILEHVLRTATAQQGGPPARVVLTCPANWGPYKRELLEQAARMADLPGVALRTEPEAAAIAFAAGERMADGDVIAVYDLGGGTFDAAVLRRTTAGFELLGTPEGVEQLGGMDFDEAVFEHVVQAIPPEQLAAPDVAALARLRRDCVEAKEALSDDTEVQIPVALPGVHTRIRLTRAEFEDMIRPGLGDTVTALRRALRSAAVRPEQLRTILLSGGSSRIPLVAQLLSTEFGRPVTLDPHPEHSIALGAARSAPPTAAAAAPPPATAPSTLPSTAPFAPPSTAPFSPPGVDADRTTLPVPVDPWASQAIPLEPDPAVHSEPAAPSPLPAPPPDPTTVRVSLPTAAMQPGPAPIHHPTAPPPRRRVGRRAQVVLAALAVLLIAGGAGWFVVQKQDDDPDVEAGGPRTPAPVASSAAAPLPDCTYIETFDGDTVDASWERTRPDADLSIARSRIVMTAPDGSDIYPDKVDAPMLLREANGDFVLETTVEAAPDRFYQGAGLVVFADPEHYVRLEIGFGDIRAVTFEYRNGGEHTKVIPADRDDSRMVPVKTSGAVLQLARKGGTVTARWRPGGDDDTSDLATVNMDLPETFKVGVSVLNWAQKGAEPKPFAATFFRVALTC